MSSSAEAITERQDPAVNPWIIAIAVMLGTFMEVLDTTVVNVSLPHIAGNLSASVDESTWVLTSYLVANAIILPMTVWLANHFGRKRVLMLSVALFGIFSLATAQVWDLNSLLAQSDFVSCHMPLTPETRNFFNYERFSKMKPTAFFLNLARGEVVDEKGLLQALKENKIAGVGLDVREQEPPASTPFAGMDNVILTPHIAAFTKEAQERVVAAVCQDIGIVLAGGAAKNFVNFPKPKRS